jgi:EpsI family protein
LFIVAAMAVLIAGGAYAVRGGMKPRDVEMPAKDFRTLPVQIGPWHGTDEELNREVFSRIGADVVIDRAYKNDAGRSISLHTAVFTDPDTGIYHSPINCYRSNGWQKLKDTRMELRVGEERPVEVSYTTWEKEGQRVLVVYWYKIGEHFLFDRFEMGGVRWKMRGQRTWPALVKVLMQTAATGDPQKDEAELRDFAEQVYRWVHEPDAAPRPGPPAESSPVEPSRDV